MVGNNLLEKPNPKATIGFVIYYPFQYYVYKNVYKYLAEEAEFVVDLGVFFPKDQSEELMRSIIALLLEEKVYFRILNNCDYRLETYLSGFFKQYRALVSTWLRGCMLLSQTSHAKKIHMTYGVGKELTTFDLQKKNFDLILAYGEFDHRFYSLLTESVIVGNPKFDNWFNKKFDETLIARMQEKIDKNKKTILYLPTHSDLSSIRKLAPALKKIASHYNVVTKLHYFTSREQPKLAEKLTDNAILLLGDESDLLTLLWLADVVVSDNSSAIFDAVLADKPIAVTNFHPQEYFDTAHKHVRVYPRGETSALTYSNSIEQRIKRDGTVITFDEPEGLGSAIIAALKDSSELQDRRKELRKDLFAYRDKECGSRAATAIQQFLSRPEETSRKPFLYHALENYDAAYNRIAIPLKFLHEEKRARMEEVAVLELVKEGCIFTCIFFAFEEKSFFERTLLSLCHQRLAKENYEITILCNSMDEEELRAHVQQIQGKYTGARDTHIRFMSDNGLTGHLFQRAIAEGRGIYVATTSSGIAVPANWLLDLHTSFKKNFAILGVGGYVHKSDPHPGVFDELSYFEIGKRLRILSEPAYLSKTYEMRNNLFEQNPAGDIRDMAYTKEFLLVLPFLPRYISAEHLGFELKARATRQGDILFIPCGVESMLPALTVRQFAARAMDEGAIHALVAKQYPSGQGRDSLFEDVLLNLLKGYRKWTLTAAIILAHFCRFAAYLQVQAAFSEQSIKKRPTARLDV